MPNTYLEGLFGPVREETTLTELEVTGALPEHLDGRYLRNGPNPIGEIDPATYHWFTGDGMVHGIRLRDGRAEWYRNRWVRSDRVAAALGEPSRSRRRHRAGMDAVAANTNVIQHASRTIALIESGMACFELTDELDTVGPCDFDGSLSGGYTAHPKRDPETGELHAVSYHFGRGNKVQYSVIGTDGRARRTVDVEVGGSPMMHDFSLTENYAVLYDLPVTFNVRQVVDAAVPRALRTPARLVLEALIGRVRVPDPVVAAQGRRIRSNAGLPYAWDPDYRARVGVLPREGTADQVRWFDVEPCYVFHPMNAYEDTDGSIVLDVVRHPSMFRTEHRGPNEGPPTLDRWTIDLAAGKVRESRLDDQPQEFPRVDERLLGRRHRYGYAAGVELGGTSVDRLIKHDLVSGTSTSRSFGAGTQVGEFVFVETPGEPEEGVGSLMGMVHTADSADLVVLDAGTLEDVARVHLPVRVPLGFHGNWCPSDA